MGKPCIGEVADPVFYSKSVPPGLNRKNPMKSMVFGVRLVVSARYGGLFLCHFWPMPAKLAGRFGSGG
jgi:hypothetical protein